MKKILDQIMILCCMAAALFCFTFCSDDLDIQQEFPERFILSAISSLTGMDC